jgi:hypothetical protein
VVQAFQSGETWINDWPGSFSILRLRKGCEADLFEANHPLSVEPAEETKISMKNGGNANV